MGLTWQWWVAQGFAVVGLIFVVISFQQKTTVKLIWLRNIATIWVFSGLLFLGNISAIIMCGAGVVRNAVSLFFAYKPSTKKLFKFLAGLVIVALLIVLNIVFWVDYLNLFSIVLGIFNVVTFLQAKAAKIRAFSVVAEILAITFYALLLSPINVIIEIIGLISAIIGIVRLDMSKKHSANPTQK